MDGLTFAYILAAFAAGYICGRPWARRYYPSRSLGCWLRMTFYRWRT